MRSGERSRMGRPSKQGRKYDLNEEIVGGFDRLLYCSARKPADLQAAISGQPVTAGS